MPESAEVQAFDRKLLQEAFELLHDGTLVVEQQGGRLRLICGEEMLASRSQLENIEQRLSVASAKLAAARDKIEHVLVAARRLASEPVQP